MVVDASWRFVTGRQLPLLTQISAVSDSTGLTLSVQGSSLQVPTPDSSQKARKVTVWSDTVNATDAGDDAAEWLSAYLGRAVRLVFQQEAQQRLLSPERRDAPGDHVSFADGYPLLLIGTASLGELNGRLSEPVSMAHFRPNIVVETDRPFIEDDWSLFEIGVVQFRVASPCSRCIFTTVDPATGTRHPDRQPLETLRQYRQDPVSRKIFFGVNVIAKNVGQISVGDALVVS